MNGTPNKRAAVVIGVSTSAGLTPLVSAPSSASEIGDWLRQLEPGYDVTVITDKDSKPVTRKQIFDAVSHYLTPTRYEMLVIYYIGHGLFQNASDVWMLSGAPGDPAECVNFDESRDSAKFCGVKNVVFVSDACRSLPATLGQARLQPSSIFPFLDRFPRPTGEIDYFCATAEGLPAYEGTIEGTRQSFLTHALRAAYRTPRPNMLRMVDYDGKARQVVPNRALKAFLRDTITETLSDVDFTKIQPVEVNVVADDDVFMAVPDPAPPVPPTPEAPLPRGTPQPAGAAKPDVPAPAGVAPGLFRSRPKTVDDLTKIHGIGRVMRDRLQALGVYRVAQIAEWEAPEIDWVTARLRGYRGRIDLDDWIAQARSLTAAPAAPPEYREPQEIVRRALTGQPVVPGAPMATALTEDMRARMPDARVQSFETETGFTLSGAKIRRVAVSQHPMGGGHAERAPEKVSGTDLGVIRVHPNGPAGQIAIRLADGRCLLLPFLRGYIGHIHMEPSGMAALSYVPSIYSPRAAQLGGQGPELDTLRAAATLALDERRFDVGDAARGNGLATAIRTGGIIDPVLGLYAAYAYSDASQDDLIPGLSSEIVADLAADLFDVRLLSNRRWTEAGLPPVVPACPLLTRGWNLLPSRGATLPPALQEAGAHLTNALWTTFGPEASGLIFDAIQKGEI